MTEDAPANEDWPRLGRFVAQRVEHLGLQQSEIQIAGGPSPAKLRDIVHGRADTLRTTLRRGLEQALRWPSGTIDQILNGAAPPDDDDNTALADMTDDQLLAELCRRLAMRHDKPKYPIPLDFRRRPPGPERKDSGVGGDEQGDKRHQVGG